MLKILYNFCLRVFVVENEWKNMVFQYFTDFFSLPLTICRIFWIFWEDKNEAILGKLILIKSWFISDLDSKIQAWDLQLYFRVCSKKSTVKWVTKGKEFMLFFFRFWPGKKWQPFSFNNLLVKNSKNALFWWQCQVQKLQKAGPIFLHHAFSMEFGVAGLEVKTEPEIILFASTILTKSDPILCSKETGDFLNVLLSIKW